MRFPYVSPSSASSRILFTWFKVQFVWSSLPGGRLERQPAVRREQLNELDRKPYGWAQSQLQS
ncbi:hypothetical protein PAXINDRAFT_20409 [Paxillus involutus ATCC 200175]|uniref:Uncharacterized protein n=1 Tax=Paxillus involutus ATCC 200175 TaxID=664439 RepID=A0A0C9SV13_PAXIN|nr:hypothetical protein PAXINDRAFT_20409 [Paxillus involutus ATCC 200175]